MDTDQLDLRRQYDEQGYFVIRELIEPSEAQRLRTICDDVLDRWVARDPVTGKPGDREGYAMRHLIHPDLHREDRSGLIELLEFAADPRILQTVKASTGFDPLFRCTTLMFNPTVHSLDGPWHRDSQFTTSTDEAEKKMIFAPHACIHLQIALVASEDAEYVPGSQLRWDTPEEYRIRKGGEPLWRSNDMPGAMRVPLQPGDAVAFNQLGLHRGRYHTDKLRRTCMLTYTSVEQPKRDKFSMQPWFTEPGYLDGLSSHARQFYEEFIQTFERDWPALASARELANNR